MGDHGTLGAEHLLIVCFVGANDAGAASGGHLTFGRFASSSELFCSVRSFIGRLAGIKIGSKKREKKTPRACAAKQKPHFFNDHPTAATRETRNDRSGIPAVGGRQSGRSHRTDQADDRDARGEVTRD